MFSHTTNPNSRAPSSRGRTTPRPGASHAPRYADQRHVGNSRSGSPSMICDVDTVDMVQPQCNLNAPSGQAVTIINVNQPTQPQRPQSWQDEIFPREPPQNTSRNLSSLHSDTTSQVPIRHYAAGSEPKRTKGHAAIYVDQLLTQKRGYPLFVPGPGMQLPQEYRRNGIEIGDVGIIKRDLGIFDFLFNIFLSADHPINLDSVPPSFSPLDLGKVKRDIHTTTWGCNSYLTSLSVRNARSSPDGLIFETSNREGAILIMPEGALSRDLLNLQSLYEYVEGNARHWYDYVVNRRGRMVGNGDIRVVIGCDKAISWGISTFKSNIEREGRIVFKNMGVGPASQTYGWDFSGSESGRVGPQEAEIQDLRQNTNDSSILQNQCLFVRTTNVSFSEEIWSDLAGARQVLGPASSQTSEVGRNERPSSRSGRVFPNPMVVHPSMYLNNLMLRKYPEAKMVITQDANWISILNDEDFVLPIPEKLCERILASHDVLESNGTLSLRLKNTDLNRTMGNDVAIHDPMDPIRTDLPSTVEETLRSCPRFRILVVGKTGVGKSSLVCSVFNLKLSEIDIAHERAGKANIDFGYTSPVNPRFILHDSQGFEAGSTNQRETVESFLRRRSAPETCMDERVHAIWLCIETPRTGARLLQTGDEMLLVLARDLKIPVIVVFTKYDILVTDHYRKIGHCVQEERQQKSRTQAQADFKRVEAKVQLLGHIKCVKVSTHAKYSQRNETLEDLTNSTWEILHDLNGELWVPWSLAQQISARQKVDTSISEGLKKYWLELGTSAIFSGHRMIECIWRIHDDIVKVWNFNDPDKLLAGQDFLEGMFLLVKPVSERLNNTGNLQPTLWSDSLLTVVKGLSPTLVQVIAGVGLGIAAVKFLYGLYEKVPLTSQYLGTYIVDLTVILHNLFMTMLARDPPRVLTRAFLNKAMGDYKQTASGVHRRICTIPTVNFEQKIRGLIQEALGYGPN